MIAGITTVLNEADIIESTIRHLLAEGIDLVLVADGRSTDGTRDILQDLEETTQRVKWFDDDSTFHAQAMWMNLLAAKAGAQGADWIVPFDADEFWYATSGTTIADELTSLEPSVSVVDAQLWHHRDFSHRYVVPEGLPKVAYRWSPQSVLAMGQHSVSVPDGRTVDGLLQIRHLQYRGVEHFVRKIRERAPRVDPIEKARGNGSHISSLENMTDLELRQHYGAMTNAVFEYNPVPIRGNVVPTSWGPGDDLA